MFVYVGTYTEANQGDGAGIYIYQINPDSGTLNFIQSVATRNPSFLALDRDQSHLYAVNELDEGEVSAFTRNSTTGKLTEINRQSSHGAHPCFISLDPSGQNVLIANYSSGVVAVLPISTGGGLEPASTVIQHTGSSVHPTRQRAAYAHSIAPTPDGRFILAADLGIDQILIYQLNPTTGKLTPNADGPISIATAPGAGPRHFAFSADGSHTYVINELDSSITAYSYNGTSGELTSLQTISTLPVDFTGENTCAQILVSPNGRFVYGSNRGHDSIAIFAVDQTTAKLSIVGYQLTAGKDPRNFNIDPSGTWLLVGNQHSDTLVSYRIDQATGLLTESARLSGISRPVAILFAA